MARPRSEDKRSAILAAATRVMASQGLSAPTALIAKEAGISSGSLFTYFDTKVELLNQLYLELKSEMASAALAGITADGEIREQLFQMWTNGLNWAKASPEKRRTLAQLGVSGEITPASLQIGHQKMAGVAQLLERSRANGPMAEVPLSFVAALINAVTDTTVDYLLQNPEQTEKQTKVAFEALWRMIA